MNLEERRKELLKKRPYLNKWFRDDEVIGPKGKNLLYRENEFLDDKAIKNYLGATPSQVAVGRTGTRYKTTCALEMRAGHAIAKDAVYSEVEQKFLDTLGAINLSSLCEDREDYLLNPAKGRRLNADSLQKLEREGTKNADIQIIVGDGLAAWAVERNVLELLPTLTAELQNSGFNFGKLLFVRFARVGVQDQIGVTLNAKATVILVGERPGLGTGDSLSAYIAYNPKIDQDNSEKNCVSNIRHLGIQPRDAAKEIVQIISRASSTGRGGVSRQ